MWQDVFKHAKNVIIIQTSSNTDELRLKILNVTKHLQTIPNKRRRLWYTKQTSAFVGECLIVVPWALKTFCRGLETILILMAKIFKIYIQNG